MFLSLHLFQEKKDKTSEKEADSDEEKPKKDSVSANDISPSSLSIKADPSTPSSSKTDVPCTPEKLPFGIPKRKTGKLIYFIRRDY